MSREVIKVKGSKSEVLSPGFRAGDFIYTSGQIGRDPQTGEIAETIQEQTRLTLENVREILKIAGATMNDVVKVTVFLADMTSFEEMNKVYITYFDEPRPSRSCVGTKLVGPNMKVEIEVVAYKPRK